MEEKGEYKSVKHGSFGVTMFRGRKGESSCNAGCINVKNLGLTSKF